MSQHPIATWSQRSLCLTAYFAVVVCTSATTIQKAIHGRVKLLLAYLLLFAVIQAVALLVKAKKSLCLIVLAACSLCFFVEAAVVYPIVDGRKAIRQGSDEDDAIILAANRMVHGQYPYAVRTYLGGSVSDGPGWIALYLPFVLLKLYPCVEPLLFCMIAWMLYRQQGLHAATIWMTLLFVAPVVHHYTAAGFDLLTLSAALLLLVMCIDVQSLGVALVWAVLAGCIMTARVNLIAVSVVLLILRGDVKCRLAWVQGITAVLVTLVWHAAFYLHNPTQYAPLHLATKAQRYLSAVPLALPICFLATLGIVWLTRKGQPWKLTAGLSGFLFVSHLPLALGSAVQTHYNLALWEGSEYLSVSVVLAAGGAALWMLEKQGEPQRIV